MHVTRAHSSTPATSRRRACCCCRGNDQVPLAYTWQRAYTQQRAYILRRRRHAAVYCLCTQRTRLEHRLQGTVPPTAIFATVCQALRNRYLVTNYICSIVLVGHDSSPLLRAPQPRSSPRLRCQALPLVVAPPPPSRPSHSESVQYVENTPKRVKTTKRTKTISEPPDAGRNASA